MKWLYYIPHNWEEERTTWEDIWLQPTVREVGAESYWLTVSINEKPVSEYAIAGDEMYVPDPFTKKELLAYAKIWLSEQLGVTSVSLIEGAVEEFEDSNDHARGITVAKRRADELSGESSTDGRDA